MGCTETTRNLWLEDKNKDLILLGTNIPPKQVVEAAGDDGIELA
jgi:hypothetical protein